MFAAGRVSTPSTRLVLLVLTWVAVLLFGATSLVACSSSSSPGASGNDAGLDVATFDTSTPTEAGDGATAHDGEGGTSDAGITVTVTGASGPLSTQQERDFAATVTGTTNTAVTWSVVEPTGGAVTAAGQYTAPATAGTYHVMATSSADPAASAQVAVDVVAAPIATMSAPGTVTTGATGLPASVPSQTGVTYAWTITGGTITTGASTNAITFTAGAPGSLVLTCVVTNAAGGSATGTATVVVSSAVVVSVTAPTVVTAGDTGLMASVPTETGATYAWTISGGTITSGATTGTVTFTAGAVGTLTLSCTITIAGVMPAGTANIQVVAVPVAVITAPASVGVGATGLMASVPTQAGATYVWSISGGTITAGDGTAAITFTAGTSGTVTLTCTVTNAAGATANTSANVAVVSAPTTPIITAPGQATTATTGLGASIAAQPGSTYAWTITGGTITSDPTASSITFTAGAVGTLTLGVTVTNAAGTATAAAIVAVVAGAVVSINAPTTAASGTPGLVASVPSQTGATYAWTITDGTITAGQATNTITFTAGAAGALTLGCTVTVAATPTTGSTTVTILDAPTTPTITAPSVVTADTTGFGASVVPQTGVTFAWTITGGTITSGAATASVVFTSGDVGTLTLSVSATNAVGTANASAIVTLVGTPTVPVTAPATAVTGTAGLTASVPAVAGDTYVWTITGGTITGGQGTSTITFTAGAQGTLSLTCTLTDGSGNQTSGSGTVNVVSATASLTVLISGIPANGSVTVTGPNSFSSIINATQTLSGLAPGAYVVSAPPFVFQGLTYTAVVAGSPVTLGVDTGNVTVTYTPFDNPPTVTTITAQTVYTNNSITIPFTIGDAEDAPSALVLTAGQVPAGIVTSSFGGTGTSRTLMLTGLGTAGTTQLTVTVTDTQGKTATTTFTVTVVSATVTTLTDSGAGSLRAILAAVPAGIVVTFDPSLNGMTIALSSAITIAQSQTLQGPGAAMLSISGGAATQMLVISSSGTVTISGLTLTGGSHAGATSNGGAIDNEGTLTVTSCTFTANTAGAGGGAIVSGVNNASTLTITGSTFSSNTAYSQGGAIFFEQGTLTVTGSTFTSNTSGGEGGAIENDDTATITGSTFATNSSAAQGGGAIYNDGTLTVGGSMFTSNTVKGGYGGGAIYNDGNATALSVAASTFASNTAAFGGAIADQAGMTVKNATYSLNSSGQGAAMYLAGGGTVTNVTVSGNTGSAALLSLGNTPTLVNSIVAGNASGDLSGTFMSGGYNVLGSSPGGFTAGTGDLTGVTSMALALGTLGNCGGPTTTMSVDSSSAAYEIVPLAKCTPATDQRGNPRPGITGQNCTAGAFEPQPSDVCP